jgi:ABC-2 type transport system ATP-binding protein
LSEMSLMADDLVVIGRGKLIASGSIESFIKGAKGAGIFVRADKPANLKRLFATHGYEHEAQGEGFVLSGVKTTDEVGRIAFAAGITLLELSKREVSLEDAFLEITASSQEYRTGDKTAKPRRDK